MVAVDADMHGCLGLVSGRPEAPRGHARNGTAEDGVGEPGGGHRAKPGAPLAACTTLQLVQARDGRSNQGSEVAFTAAEVRTLEALLPGGEGKTAAQKNTHPPHSLAWAAWIVAKLGGWDGYKSSKPPRPITFRHGLEHFHSIAYGWSLKDV